VIAYQTIAECQATFSTVNCWDVRSTGFGFYVAVMITLSGAIILAGPTLLRSLRELKGSGSDSN